MSKHTKTMLLIATLYFLGLVVVLTYGLFQVYNQGLKYEDSRAVIADQSAKKASYATVERLLESSAADRALVQSFFLAEKDTINFISDIETAAAVIGVKLVTNQLETTPAVAPDGTPAAQQLLVTFTYEGSESSVKRFMSLLENLPYHVSIPQTKLTISGDKGVWSGVSALRITMTP